MFLQLIFKVYWIVDEMHHEHPELDRDQYWDEVFPQELPYTLAFEHSNSRGESWRQLHLLQQWHE